TSGAEVRPAEEAPEGAAAVEEAEGLRVVPRVSEASKCGRCWHRRDSVGTHPGHPELCDRCLANIEGAGEARRLI
ncbi:MAG TPA: zinc finger domain-containing protein, partial [Gammaproteobacteria bacterium]|nr:zinc finger domain-containing protein [Gammaproteobacteria bacterium]